MAGLRDRLAHGYFGLADEVIWEVIGQHLAELRREPTG
ncbi:MAG: HepT-like ribonuclease domain-containing protein [Gemmatimonadaceae bacterium]